MLSKEQKIWLDHLDDTNETEIVEYNPKTKDIFKIIKNELIGVLGNVRISHRGSTALKISGQGEIDLYIPVSNKDFDIYLDKLIKHLGKPGSLYPLERVRFLKFINGIKIEVFLINKNNSGWKDGVKFEKYLKQNPHYLKEYEDIKTKMRGTSTKKYYTAKTEFINKILDLAQQRF